MKKKLIICLILLFILYGVCVIFTDEFVREKVIEAFKYSRRIKFLLFVAIIVVHALLCIFIKSVRKWWLFLIYFIAGIVVTFLYWKTEYENHVTAYNMTVVGPDLIESYQQDRITETQDNKETENNNDLPGIE